MTRIAFTADLHVDSYGQRVDPATGLNARLVDYLTTLRFVAREAEESGCAALVIAGDFTERRHPAPWLVNKIDEALDPVGRLICLRGNHDGEIAGGSIVNVLTNGRRFRTAVSRPLVDFVGHPHDVAICAIPYLDRHWIRAQPGCEDVPDSQIFRALAEQFVAIARGLYAEAEAARPGCAKVLVCHQTLAGGQLSETQQAFLGDLQVVVDARELAAIGFEAVVAGHLHRHQVLEARIPVLYTGSIERVDFGEEHEAKGFVVADVAPGRFDWQFVETPARRFVTVTDAESVATEDIVGAIVRYLDLDPAVDRDAVRRAYEEAGAFEVTEIRHRQIEQPDSTGGMSESLSAEQALEAYFLDDPDREPLVERGRRILEEVAA